MTKKIFSVIIVLLYGFCLHAQSLSQDSIDGLEDTVESDTISIPSKEEILASGIPNGTMSAKAYFTGLGSHYVNGWNEISIIDSRLSSLWQDFDVYYFFVKPTAKRTEEYPLVDLWAYDANKHNSKLVYHQVDDSIDTRNVVGIDWMYGGKEHSEPMLILSTIGTMQTSHYDYNTVIIDVLKDKTITLKGQKFVSVLHINDEMLLTEEIGQHESYILTTTSNLKTIKGKDVLVPNLSVYNSRGILVRKISLPDESILDQNP